MSAQRDLIEASLLLHTARQEASNDNVDRGPSPLAMFVGEALALALLFIAGMYLFALVTPS